jgi:hypothetical protein
MDVQKLTEVLIGDVMESVHAIDPQRSATARAYVRTVFALVEGTQSGMSTYLLEGHAAYGWELSDDERRLLWDAVPDSSVERPIGGRATLIQRLKLLMKSGHRVFGEHCQLDFGGRDFQAFSRALVMRDRLMHPKRSKDLDVRDNELADVDKARDWFRAGAKRFFEAATMELRIRIDK